MAIKGEQDLFEETHQKIKKYLISDICGKVMMAILNGEVSKGYKRKIMRQNNKNIE